VVAASVLAPSSVRAAQEQEGVPPQACATTIQALVDAAAPGATVSVPACTYRETVRIGKPLTLVGEPGAELRGSDIWSDWSAEGATWISRQAVPRLPEVSRDPKACEPNTNNRCLWPEQVFVDGKQLEPVAPGGQPGAGQFALVGGGDRRVRLGQDPRGRTVEVSTRPRWIVTAADGVTIRGMIMRHAGNGHASGAISNDGRSDWTLADSVLSEAHAANVSLDHGVNVRVVGNDISRAGLGGVYGQRVDGGGLVQGNVIHDNRTALFSHDWGAAGLKLADVDGFVIDGNEVAANDGVGLWCDITCNNVTFSHNRVHHNTWQGINFEISTNAAIYDNAIWENGWGKAEWGWGAGIVISTSANADVASNAVAWNYAGISVISQARADAPPQAPGGNLVRDNIIAKHSVHGDFSRTFWHNLSLGWLSDNVRRVDEPSRNNRAINNRFWYDQPEGQSVRFAWGTQFKSVSEFAEEPGGQGSSYVSLSELEAELAARGMPLAPEPR
jgi:hypothetical protein